MFVVYAPEGRQTIPMESLIPPVKPIGKVESAEAVGEEKFAADMPLESAARRAWLKHRALRAYRQQHQSERRQAAMEARGLMEPVETMIEEDMLLEAAWQRLEQARQPFALVVNRGASGRLTGVLHRKDFLGHVWRERRHMKVRVATVASVMQTPVLSCHLHAHVRYVALVMSRHGAEVMPVVTETDQVLGVVTAERVLQQLAQCGSLDIVV